MDDTTNGPICGCPFEASLGVEGYNQINQRLTRHHLLQPGEKLLAFGMLFSSALLVIIKTKLFAAHQTSPSQQSEHDSHKF